MGKIVFMTNIERQDMMMQRAYQELKQDGRLQITGRIIRLNDSVLWGPAWQQTLAGSDLVLLYWMGTDHETAFIRQAVAFLRSKGMRYAVLANERNGEAVAQGVTPDAQRLMRAYFLYSGLDNYRNLWLWLSRVFCRQDSDYQLPQLSLWNGIFHPRAECAFTDGEAYRREFCRPDRPTVGILFARDEWVWGDLAYQTALVDEIERQGMNAMAVFSPWARSPQLNAPGVDGTVRTYFFSNHRPAIDVLINTFKFSLTMGRPVESGFLNALGVPVLQAYALLRPREEWEGSGEGMTPMEVSCSVALPEFDGVIHSLPVAAKESMDDGARRYLPVPERLAAVVRKAAKWARLRRQENSEKKLAIIFHNYPPNNASIGSAAGLDSPESVRLLLAGLKERGYRVDRIPADSRALIDELVAQGTNDRRYLTQEQIARAAGKLSAHAYRQFFRTLAAANREQLTGDWGEPPGEVFEYDGNLLVPGTLNGNVFITVQPPRGFGEDPGKILHSPDCAPTHHYLAYYQWIRDIFQADAVIHIGTHGSLEWLPGKGTALSNQCYPDVALGDLPNIYPYLITIVGEGTQAKRRGVACLIGHLPPPVSHAGTYDELAELEKLLDEYCHIKVNRPENLEPVIFFIREKVAEAKLQEEIPQEAGEALDDYIQRLHAYITDLKNMQIRVGLHILGRPPAEAVLVEYLLALIRMENSDVPSLPKKFAAILGYDYYELLEHSGSLAADGGKSYGMLVNDIRDYCRQALLLLAEKGFDRHQVERVLTLPILEQATQHLRDQVLQVARHVCTTLVPSLEKTEQEITNLLAALEGEYVEPGPAGAPTSGMPDILPTGRNFYGVDPRTLPTAAAWELGRSLGDSVIERYIREEGRYPENIGMVLWSGANMRSNGQCIAEFLYLLGVRPVWQKGSRRVIDLEIIPPEALKRPRIDVTARVSGLFRDAMPQAVHWLDRAVSLVAQLDESPESNYVRKHVLQDAGCLEAQGAESRQAWQQACYRVFGCPPGVYGAGIGHLLAAKNWETVDDLAQVYVKWGAHAYGADANGQFAPQLFRRRLRTLDVTIKNEDNREVNLLSSDDFNAYHGGMIAAVRSLKGEAPRSYCGDSSDRRRTAVRSLQEEFRRLFRGEVMNPKYIEGMKNHGYKGAADLAGVVAHSYQWDATSAIMEDWMYKKFADKYALDEDMREWMRAVNPWALQRIAETLLEAAQRGLWQADDGTREELQKLYLSIEGELEEHSDCL